MQTKPNKQILLLMALLMLSTLVVPFIADRQKLGWEMKHRVRVVLDIGQSDRPAETQSKVMAIELARLHAMELRNVTAVPDGSTRLVFVVPGVEEKQRVSDFLVARGNLDIGLVPVDINPAVEDATGAATFTRAGQTLTPAQVIAAATPVLAGNAVQVAPRVSTDKQGRPLFQYAAADGNSRQQFAKFTKDNIGHWLVFASEGRIITVQQIAGMQLTGTFARKYDDPREVGILDILLSAGPLPAPVRVVECEKM